jgi:hypothetical protein
MVEAEAGEPGLKVAQHESPDQLKKNGDARAVIMITADPQLDDVKVALKLGAYDFVGHLKEPIGTGRSYPLTLIWQMSTFLPKWRGDLQPRSSNAFCKAASVPTLHPAWKMSTSASGLIP